MADLFVSYKTEDRARVKPLVDALRAQGYSIWWDEHIGAGDQWRDEILRHLEAARVVIVVWSKHSIGPQGSFVRDEATRALRRGTYVPVRIDEVEPPLGFGETQAINLQGWSKGRSNPKYQSLLAAITARIGAAPSDGAEISSRSDGRTRRAVLAGGAALVAVGGLGVWSFFRRNPAADRSIAVLPFANLSGDETQSYFSDGIAEELRSILSRIPGLKVVARTSSEAVRNADTVGAASKLHVRNILTGSVRRSSRTVRIGAQLVDGSSGIERWSEVYDRPVGDMLQIQSEIATMVAQSLSIRLEGAQQRSLKEGGTENPDAQDLLLHAQAVVWRNDDATSLRVAREMIDRALALDARYADAVAAKAAILNAQGSFFASSAEDARQKNDAAEKVARDAIRLAPKSAMAHAALGSTLWSTLRLSAGLAEFDEAANYSGGSLSFFNGFDPHALALICCRRVGAAVARTERLVAMDPLNPNALLTKGVVLLHARRYAESYDAMTQAIALGPELRWPRAFQAFCLMQMGKLDEAAKQFAAIPGTGPWLSFAAALAARQGRKTEAERLLTIMRNEMRDAGNFQYAEVFAQDGQTNEAIAALERAWRARDPGLAFMNVDALLDPVRTDPRFQAIAARLNFPPH